MSKIFNAPCPVCRLPAVVSKEARYQNSQVECPRCGRYSTALESLDLSAEQIANASGYISENEGFVLLGEDEVKFLQSIKTPTVGQKAEKLLRRFAENHPTAGSPISIFSEIDAWMNKHKALKNGKMPIPISETFLSVKEFLAPLAYGWAQNEAELNYILYDYLVNSAGLITGKRSSSMTTMMYESICRISPDGWRFLNSTPRADGSIAFVAMWFNVEVADLWSKAIHPAVESCGYVPLRIDKKEHNNKIDDEIIAAIRECRFLIADFTGQRGGVYYEAGFAGGLGKSVIWTVRQDALKEVHFDTRQFNHIPWEADKLDVFREALKNRMLATIGRGPIS